MSNESEPKTDDDRCVYVALIECFWIAACILQVVCNQILPVVSGESLCWAVGQACSMKSIRCSRPKSRKCWQCWMHPYHHVADVCHCTRCKLGEHSLWRQLGGFYYSNNCMAFRDDQIMNAFKCADTNLYMWHFWCRWKLCRIRLIKYWQLD